MTANENHRPRPFPGARPYLTLISAVAANGVIGNTVDGVGVLPWHLPEDLKRFKQLTEGNTVIMGRKTWESLPEKFRPLPRRRNIVITRNPAYVASGADVYTSIPAALLACAAEERVFVIGGAELYRQALAEADCLELTELHQAFEGDTKFPDYPREEWRQVFRDCVKSDSGMEFDFVTYERA